MHRWLFVPLLMISVMSSAQRTMTASGSFVYNLPSSMSPDQAKATALDRAKIQLIADNFGTVVGVNTSTVVSSAGDDSSVSYLSMGESEVRGEWIQTKGEPSFDITYEQNMLNVTVSVTGVIREVNVSRTDYVAKVLRNGTSEKFESSDFRSDDDMFVHFQSPEAGYVAIYLYDQSGVYRLLPLKNQSEGSIRVEADTPYTFFEQARTSYLMSGSGDVRSIYTVTCSGDTEFNRIYVVYSPNRFTKAVDTVPGADTEPPFLTFEAFQRWLSKCRKHDLDMTVAVRDIIIRNR